MMDLIITDKRIKSFYNNNPDIDFQTVNLLFIELFGKVLCNKENNTNIDNREPNVEQTKFMSEMMDILNKFRSNDICQQHNDKHLLNILTKLYSNAEVNVPIKNNTSGWIVLKRQGRTPIIIENRDINTNVTAEEVQAFATIIDEQNCNGIFLSQNSGISSKKNYQIEIHNNNVMIFVHDAQYNPAKITAAVDIIDQLSNKIRQFKNIGGDDCHIPKDIMDSINNEYQLFLSQKNAVIEVFKESQKKVFAQIDELRFPTLDKFLSTKYTVTIQKPGLKCDLCKSSTANNLKALAAHKRGCIRKNAASNIIVPPAIISTNTTIKS